MFVLCSLSIDVAARCGARPRRAPDEAGTIKNHVPADAIVRLNGGPARDGLTGSWRTDRGAVDGVFF
jgi:hypothetical protein